MMERISPMISYNSKNYNDPYEASVIFNEKINKTLNLKTLLFTFKYIELHGYYMIGNSLGIFS